MSEINYGHCIFCVFPCFFFLNFLQVLDSAALTACLDIVLWLLVLDELQKVVLFLTNFLIILNK